MGGHWFKTSLDKKLVRLHLNKPGIVIHACHPSYTGGIGRRTTIQCKAEDGGFGWEAWLKWYRALSSNSSIEETERQAHAKTKKKKEGSKEKEREREKPFLIE